MNVRFKFNLRCLYSGKNFSLLFVIMLLSFSLVSVFGGGTLFVAGAKVPDKVVKTVAELRSAVSAAPDKTSYVIGLGNDIVLDNSLEISESKSITLVSVGGFWKLIGANRQYTVIVDGMLTIDSICVTHMKGDNGRGVCVNSGATFVLSGDGEVSGNVAIHDGAGVYVYSEGTFRMIGGVISGNSAVHGGGVYNEGVFELVGGVISGNSADYGGGVYNTAGSFVMPGGKLVDNKANYGGGVHSITYNGGSFAMSDGEISGNVAEYYGGGVNFIGGFDKSGGVIFDNSAGWGENYNVNEGYVGGCCDEASGGDGMPHGLVNAADGDGLFSGFDVVEVAVICAIAMVLIVSAVVVVLFFRNKRALTKSR